MDYVKTHDPAVCHSHMFDGVAKSFCDNFVRCHTLDPSSTTNFPYFQGVSRVDEQVCVRQIKELCAKDGTGWHGPGGHVTLTWANASPMDAPQCLALNASSIHSAAIHKALTTLYESRDNGMKA